jgi:peptidoglycan/xylan/chitin deacetylase (PgdA/CDA1 family)
MASRTGRGDVLFLCYHGLSEDWPARIAVTPREFEFQIGLLASRGYRGVTFTEAALGNHIDDVVAVTFDDGYRSVDELARPILDRHGLPGTVFVPTRLIGGDAPMVWEGIDQWIGGPHEQELLPMSWQKLGSLADSGWEIGSHTLTHPHLTEIGTDELRDQLVESRHECSEKLGRDCTSIAFPYGEVDDRVIREAEAAGYSAAAMLATRPDLESSFTCPRIGVYNVDERRAFRMKVSPAVRRLRRSRAWLPVAGLLHRLRRG